MEKHSNQINTPWWNNEKGLWLTDKTSRWATVGPAADKHQEPTYQIKSVIESEAWPTVVQLKRTP